MFRHMLVHVRKMVFGRAIMLCKYQKWNCHVDHHTCPLQKWQILHSTRNPDFLAKFIFLGCLSFSQIIIENYKMYVLDY